MDNPQLNSAVRKIHNLLSSGAVTVTGPNQPRIYKNKDGTTTVTGSSIHNANTYSHCYVCDEHLSLNNPQHQLIDMVTSHTSTKFPNKIAQLVGEAFIVIISPEDVMCNRCMNLINYLDRLENDVERVRSNLMTLLHKKYGLNDDGRGTVRTTMTTTTITTGNAVDATIPPSKFQKLNSGTVARIVEEDGNRLRKVVQSRSDSPLGQVKITNSPQQTAGTQTNRRTTKIYKCPACDFKTSDMRLFNSHYENCKQQNFQCKNCRKILPTFGTMKQHMVREHNTTMDNTCSICHINYTNESSLRKHMESHHSTSVIVTSTTTLPNTVLVNQTATEAITVSQNIVPLYSCGHCQFKSTDKGVFDDHVRKHITGNNNNNNNASNNNNSTPKHKPFKCRLCSQRFETREAATIHAKQHQPNYFKCGTCSLSFPKREMLVKHFEVHQQPPAQTVVQQVAAQPSTTTIVKQQTSQSPVQNLPSTQKLLQDTIDEALSDSVTVTTGTTEVSSTAANNIRFYSCQVCSLTFIQENYYNQHMETHVNDKKGSEIGVSTASTTNITNSSSSSLVSISPAAIALLSDGLTTPSGKKDNDLGVTNVQQSTTNTMTGNISEVDIESIFEKMHSDKGDMSGGVGTEAVATSGANTATTNTTIASSGAQAGDNLVITSQEGSGGITFNITIPQPDTAARKQSGEASKTAIASAGPIDMPMLDQADETTIPTSGGDGKTVSVKKELAEENDSKGVVKKLATGPVSMPSLDDDNVISQADGTSDETKVKDIPIKAEKSDVKIKAEVVNSVKNETVSEVENAGTENDPSVNESDEAATSEQLVAAAAAVGEQQVAMELDEAMQAQVESGQIKFLLNENGQFLQLDNHIITDAEGNQILVQDPEQIQQLLQSVGVLQTGDGLDSETLQMMTDGNGQMVLVQGENNEAQLIDASLLNADGQLVIQQGQDGELGEGAHVISEDGTRIPVSVSYTADGQPIVQVQQQVLEGGEGTTDVTGGEESAQATDQADAGGGYFALEDLMHQSSDAKTAD